MVCWSGLGKIGASGLSSGCDRKVASRAEGSTHRSWICRTREVVVNTDESV